MPKVNGVLSPVSDLYFNVTAVCYFFLFFFFFDVVAAFVLLAPS